MSDEIITFRTFDNPVSANIIRTRLESEGVACFLADENIITLNPLYNQGLGGIKLKIFARDYEKVEALLAEDNSLESPEVSADETTVTCPNCGSTDVGFGNATRNRFGIFTLLVSFLFLIFPFYSKKAWHCYSCGEEFPHS